MVGLADLKRYAGNLKSCQININNKYCYFYLSGLTTFEFLDILNYKSWVYKTYQRIVTVRYVNLIKKLEGGYAVIRTSIGFGPLLMRYIRSKGFQIRDQDIEPYRSRLVVFPDLKIKLYDFQARMVQDWLDVGGIGVVKSPTGSGKCVLKDTLILTGKGFLKIENIIKKEIQTDIEDYFGDKGELDEDINVLSLQDSTTGYKSFKVIDKHNIGIENTVSIKTNLGLKISGSKEHPIVVINDNGKLTFKKLKDVTKKDYVAITYNTQKFNDILKLKYHYRFKSSSVAWKLNNIDYMKEDMARLLGYIIAEANANISDDYAKGGSFIITNYDKEIIEDITNICRNLGLEVAYRYRENKNDGNPIGVIINSIMFTDFMYYLGYKHLARNKEVPWSILQSNKKCQIEFIKALFDGDGTVFEGESKDMVELGSSSYELCRQLQIMLLNMGIIGRLDSKKGATIFYRDEFKTYEQSYRLTFYGENVLKFAETINFGLTRKKEILDKCVEEIKNRGRWSDIVYPYLDIPFKILHEKLKEIGKNGIVKDGKRFSSSYDFLKCNSFHKEIWAYINGERLPGRSTLEKLLYLYSPIKDLSDNRNSFLKEHGMAEKIDKYTQIYNYIRSLYDNFIFDKVEEISSGQGQLYDITVEDAHSYIGNGIISHNTIVGCKAIKEIGRKTLILVHTSDLLINVWNESLIKTFGHGIMGQVGIVGGGLTDNDRILLRIGSRSGDFEENVKKDIVIATFQTLKNRLDILTQYKFGLMIVDECIPIDSKIWTKYGIIGYEDLGYGSEYKDDIFQVWSKNNNDRIIDNGYKKVKTRFKHMYKTIVETGEELVCSLDHKVLTKKDDGKEEFVEIDNVKNIARSLLRPYDMKKECILARIFGYVLGDGWVDINRDSGAGGDFEGLIRLKNDLKKLSYYSHIGKERELESTINSISLGQLNVHGSVHSIKFEKRFSELLIKLGHPIGRKTNQEYYIPDWIMNGNIEIKREFIAGYFGAESTNPGFRGDKNNKLKKSFYVPRFSINKRIDLVDKGLKLADQFKQLLEDLEVDVSDISIVEGNIRKDGTISKKIVITISNQVDNLRRYLDIGCRYCIEKEKEGEVIRSFFRYIDQCNKERNEIQTQVKELYEKGVRKNKIVTIINSRESLQKNIIYSWGAENDNKIINKRCLVSATNGIVSDILYPHKKDRIDIIAKTVKIKQNMYSFDDWKNKVKGDFIFLDVLKHEYRGYEQGYTLTVGVDHNYVVNGFVVKNCHHVPSEMFRRVNSVIRAPYKMGLSATTKRLDGLEKEVFGQLGDIQSSVSIRELINKGILAEPRFQSPIIVDQEIIDSIANCGLGGLNLSRYVKKMSASSAKKKNYIVNICKNIAARNRKFLLFTDYVSAEDVYIRDNYANSLLEEGLRVSIIDQEMSSDERSTIFKWLDTGEISGIVFGKLGSEGINIVNVDAVIMANGLKSPITYCQRVGRAMRKTPSKQFCDIYEILLDTPMELKWSEFNFLEYKMEGFQKLVYKVD